MPRLKRLRNKWTFDYNRPRSIGRVRAFYGNFGVIVRALAYILADYGVSEEKLAGLARQGARITGMESVQ